MNIRLIFSTLLLCNILISPSEAVELKEGRAIRDAEIERVLKSFLRPLFKVANLNPDNINLILVYDTDVNAAATLENTVVVNTGFLLEAESAAEVIGVLAHETAHIADGHIITQIGAAENAQIQSLIGTLLGVVIGVAVQSPELALGSMIVNQEMAKGMFLKHTRVQEGAADQGALAYLDKLGWSAEGLYTFMQKLIKHDPRTSRDDIYQYTHPLTTERVATFQDHLSKGRGRGGPLPQSFEIAFQRAKAKIEAFTLPRQQLLNKYKGDTPIDRYVLAVASFRNSEFDQALKGVNELIAMSPKDPDYWDLKGEILFESGKPSEAISAYKKAIEYDPNSPLLRALYAQAILESNNSALYPEAEQELLRASKDEPYSPFYWHLLAIAYGKQEDMGMASLALAERNLLEGSFNDATGQAKRALNYLDEGAPQRLRAEDIMSEVERLKKLTGQSQSFVGGSELSYEKPSGFFKR